MLLKARWVQRPRKTYYCGDCEKRIDGPHLYLYGAAEYGDKPWPLRFCEKCAADLVEVRSRFMPDAEDKKILAAVKGHLPNNEISGSSAASDSSE